jgi:hypothetical protein
MHAAVLCIKAFRAHIYTCTHPPHSHPGCHCHLSVLAQDRKSRHCGKGLRVVERSIFSDRQVFVRAMHSAGTMEDFEVSVYNTM